MHISTQCNISNSEAVKFYSQWADVVVLARELSLEQIGRISREIARNGITGPKGEPVRIEMFAKGRAQSLQEPRSAEQRLTASLRSCMRTGRTVVSRNTTSI